MPAKPLPVDFADIEAAARRLDGIAVTTPLLETDAINAATSSTTGRANGVATTSSSTLNKNITIFL